MYIQQGLLRRLLSVLVAVTFVMTSISLSSISVNAASAPKLTPASKTIYVGKTVKLKASTNVKWSIPKNNKVVKLTSIKKNSVVVKGLKPGTVYITAKSGKLTAKAKIKVKASGSSKIKLMPSKTQLGIGENAMIIVSTDLDDKILFSSSDPEIASVASNGLMTGVSPGEATITAKAKGKNIKAKVNITVLATRAGTLTIDVDLSDPDRYPAGKTAKVWLPVPSSDEHQNITRIKCNAPGAKEAKLTKDSEGGRQMYIEWSADTAPADRTATLTYHIYRKEIIRSDDIESMEKGTVNKSKYAKYLSETRWSGNLSSGIVKDTADKIVAEAKAKTVYEKAYAIYNYICDDTIRGDDKTVIFGDVVSMLEGKRNSGSCMDTNSLFVSLCKAEGIPARTLYGLRFANFKKSTGTTKPGGNCRAEFFLPGYGWVPVDPALAIKQGRGLDSPPKHDNDPTWLGIKDFFWGNGEENWICINMGRDITLDPPQSYDTKGEYRDVLNPEGTINLFMFPYGEYGDQYIPCMDKANFKYDYSFEEENPYDCGC